MIGAMGIADERAPAARVNNLTEWAGYLAVAPLVVCLAGVGRCRTPLRASWRSTWHSPGER